MKVSTITYYVERNRSPNIRGWLAEQAARWEREPEFDAGGLT